MSSNIAIQRIKREFVEVARFDEVNQNLISIESVNNSLVDLKGKITGRLIRVSLLPHPDTSRCFWVLLGASRCLCVCL